MTRALIIGGGIAGTVAAMALQKAGVEATVYEACPSGGDDAGAFLTVGANGMAESRGIQIEHGKRLAEAHAQGNTVLATFADGSNANGNLLIGADGLRSRVRSAIDPAAAAPRYTGERVFYGYAPDATPVSAPRVLHMIRGRKGAFGHTISPNGETWWFARIPGVELSRARIAETSSAAWRSQLVQLFRRDKTVAAGILQATGDELLVDNIYDLPGVAVWHDGPMLIIGDAAHAASPASGQGASMALEDAVMLAKALRDLPDHTDAFTAYEQLRRTRVDRIIAGGAQLGKSKTPNPISRRIYNYRARKQYAKPAPRAREWLFSYPLDWDIPVTFEHARETAAAQRPLM